LSKEIVELTEDLSHSTLYSDDLAPVPASKRTWNKWHLAALWVGMAVCIPTYLLASYMIRDGLNWIEVLVIIGLSNIIITVPMVLNGHAGVKYGVPFPVIGRSAFGTKGIHIDSVIRGLVACGWFGVQTWVGGLAIYAIYNVLAGTTGEIDLCVGKFVSFGIFWFINMYFIWKGTESIKWLEEYSAPILIIMGLVLIGWGVNKADGFGIVLKQGKQLETPAACFYTDEDTHQTQIIIHPIKDKEGKTKADSYQIIYNHSESEWKALSEKPIDIPTPTENDSYKIRLKKGDILSSVAEVSAPMKEKSTGDKLLSYMIWLTAMVGFWATMSLSIADITRFASSQKAQVQGQFIGLPGTMIFYSFVAIFATSAAIINFDDVFISNDAPWDPVNLLAKFDSPWVVIVAQISLLIATLSTNIAANVIAPANAFSNVWPKKISFKMGGILAGILGIVICPWLLLNEISGILIFISGLLGPVLGVLLSDYYLIRKKEIHLAALYKVDGAYSYNNGFNIAALIALFAGVLTALIGYFVPSFGFLYTFSWFTGFLVSFVLYYFLMRNTNVSIN
jgi:cytosine/uracil/thiamine/allantoin permease